MLDLLSIRTNPDVVWSGSCQTTGSRKHLDVTHPKTVPKSSKRKYSGQNNGRSSSKQPITAVFSGSMVAATASERLEHKNSKRVNFRFGNKSPVASGVTCNGAFKATPQQQEKSSLLVPSIASSAQQPQAMLSLPNNPRVLSLTRTQSRVEFSSLPNTTVNIGSLARLMSGGCTPEQKANNVYSANNDRSDSNPQHRFQPHQFWRRAVDSVIKNPERRDSAVRGDNMFSHTLSLPKKFTHQEMAARVVTAMRSPPPKSPQDIPPTSGASLNSDRKFFPQTRERAQSAPLMERGAMRKEIQRRLSSEAWYQKALATLREIPAYVSKADEEPSNDLEEIAKRLCRTTAASRAREAATNKVVYREPEIRDDATGHAQKIRPKSVSVTSAMINSMHRSKGHKHKPVPDVEEIVKRLSAYEADKIPDRRRIVPPEDLRQIGIMNTLSWKGQDPFQREGVNTASLEALVFNLGGR